MTLVPAVLFAALELALRLAGYGYPTSFFRKTQIAGRTVYVENDRFGLRFFPPALARIPSPTVLTARKATNTCRIFVLGESAALGDPEPAFGFGRYLEVLLRERFPEAQFEVICASMTAVNSHALLPIARECAGRDGDLWVIYMGNNEVVGPFGAGTVLGPRSPSRFSIHASLALKAMRVGQLLDATIDQVIPSATPGSWQGMKMFLNAQTRHDEPNRLRTNEHFQKNLTAILRTAKNAGIPVVLCTVATNLKDCAPFASLHSSRLTEYQLRDWQTAYQKAQELEAAGRWNDALVQYHAAAAVDGEYAELQFRLGRCHFAASQFDQARRCFQLARDFDALPFRADSKINEIIRAAGREFAGSGVALLDAEEILALASPPGITGAEVFYEHVHLNFDGNYHLARAVAEKAVTLLPQFLAGRTTREWPPAELCNRRLCVTPWDRHRVCENVIQRHTQPPFTLQLDHDRQMQMFSSQLAAIRSQLTPEARQEARALYQSGLTTRPEDFYLRGNSAKFLEDTGEYPAALAEWKHVEEMLPYHFGPSFYLGKLLARLGRYTEAEQALKKTLRLRPDVVDARVALGQVLAKQRKPDEALACFDQALRLQPGNARLHLHRAETLASAERRDESVQALRQAIEVLPDFWEARYYLGVELATREQIQGAEDQFREVVRLKPDYALAHLNLGVALAKQRRMQEAMVQFRETLRLDASNRLAQEYLSKLESRAATVSQ